MPKSIFTYSLKQPQYTNVTNQYPISSWEGFVYGHPWSSIRTPQLGDLNSDSWLDRGAQLFDGKKWVTSNIDYPFSPNDLTTVYGDFNGDGKNDFIDTLQPNNRSKMWLNNGNNFVAGWTLPSFFYPQNNQWPISQIAIADVNNDGLSDIIYAYKQWYNIGNPVSAREIWLNTGSGFTQAYGYFPVDLADCDANVYWSCPSRAVQLIDVNGDGLVDVWVSGGAYLNTGKDFSQVLDTAYAPPINNYGFLTALNNGGAKLVDVNSDGLIDIVENYDLYNIPIQNVKNVYLNTGKGFVKDNTWNIPIKMSMIQNEFYGDYGVRLFDINNDGGFDIVAKGCVDQFCGSDNMYQHVVYSSQPGKANLLISINVDNDKLYDIDYQYSATITDEQGRWLNGKLPYSLPVVKSYIEYDGLGGSNKVNYQYAYGFQYVDGVHPNDSQFAGFGVVTIDTKDKQVKDFFHQGGGFDGVILGEGTDQISLRGRLYREEVYEKEGQQKKLEKILISKWQSVNMQNSSKVFLERSITINDNNSLANSQQKIISAFKLASNKYLEKENENVSAERTGQKVRSLSSEKGIIYYMGKKDDKYEYNFVSAGINNFGYNNSGSVQRRGSGSWQQLVAGTGGAISSQNNIEPFVAAYSWVGNNGCNNPEKTIMRGYLSFDTSAIPDNATLGSTTLMMTQQELFYNHSFQEVNVVKWYTTNPAIIENKDYAYAGNVSGGSVLVNGNVVPLEFNHDAESWVSVSSTTNLALRFSEDLTGSGPRCFGNFDNPFFVPRNGTHLETSFFLYSPYTTPTNLTTNGRVNPETVKLPITFGAEFHAESVTSTASYWRAQITKTNDFADTLWDSGKRVVNGNVGVNQRVDNLVYDGPNLPFDGTKYKVRIKFWDNDDNEGTWSDEDSYFYSRLGSVGGVVNYEYDQQNNRVLKEINYGKEFVDLMTGELVLSIPGDEKTTTYEYAQSVTAKPVLTAVKKVTTYDDENNQHYVTEAHYDNLPFGQVSKSNKTKDDLLIQQINIQTEYNNYGLPKKQIDPLGNATTIEYASSNLYPNKTTNALGQITTFEYDDYIGQPISTTDANGLREEKKYDAFGRMVSVSRSFPDGKDSMIDLEKYSYNDFSMPRSVTKQTRVDDSNWLTSVEYFDGLGRSIQSRVQHTNNDYTVISTKYDQLGRVVKITLPYLDVGNAYKTESWNRPVVEKQYDGLDRVIKEISSVGTTSYDYDGFITKVTDAKGVQKKLECDAYGRLISVQEFINGGFHKTTYTYNVLGKLTKIVDSKGNERNFEYDGLGRLLSQEDMHSAGNAESVWHYEYDKNSHVIKQTDPRGEATNYEYDNLGRVTREGSTDGEINYTYDVGNNAIGKLVKTTSTFGVGYEQSPNYDLWGRTTNELVIIGDKKFSTNYKYNLTGATQEITLPNLLSYKFGYDGQGKLQTIDLASSDRMATPIVTRVEYHISGRPEKVNYANGAVTTYAFDTLTQRLNSKKTASAGANIQDTNYTYDSLGNILEILDSSQTPTAKLVKYAYDSLSRLTSATATNTSNNHDYTQTYSYDVLGNILNKSDVGDYKYGNNNPYQVANINGVDYTYDENGNVITDGTYKYLYNSANRMIGASGIYQESQYSYDPAGQRVYKKVTDSRIVASVCEKNDSGVSSDSSHSSINNNCTRLYKDDADRAMMNRRVTRTYYPNQYYELTVVNGNETQTNHLYGLGQRLAQIDNSNRGQDIKLIFTDHLGSTQEITGLDGKIISSYDYFPFGGVRLEDGEKNKKGFIGKELDETSLNYVEARYLNAATGRFGQIDPVSYNLSESTGVLNDPQSLNSYAYARNNPVVLVDDNGKFWQVAAAIALMYAPAIMNGLQALTTPLGQVTMADSAGTISSKNSSNFSKVMAGVNVALVGMPERLASAPVRSLSSAKYFQKIAEGNIDEVVNMNGLYKAKQGFEFTGKTWSIGEAQNSLASLVGHYFKHAIRVGAKTLDEYYGMANDLIKSVDNKNVFEIKNLYSPGSTDYFNLTTNNLVGLSKDGAISSFQKVFQPDKLNRIMNAVKLIKK